MQTHKKNFSELSKEWKKRLTILLLSAPSSPHPQTTWINAPLTRGSKYHYWRRISGHIARFCSSKHTLVQRVLNDLKSARLSRFLTPSPVSRLDRGDEQEDWERETTCWRKGGGGRGADSYYRKKAWSCIEHSILSALASFNTPPLFYGYGPRRSIVYSIKCNASRRNGQWPLWLDTQGETGEMLSRSTFITTVL